MRYKQVGSKRGYPGKGAPTKGRKRQRSMKKPDNDRPGMGMDMDTWERTYTGWYGQGTRPA